MCVDIASVLKTIGFALTLKSIDFVAHGMRTMVIPKFPNVRF